MATAFKNYGGGKAGPSAYDVYAEVEIAAGRVPLAKTGWLASLEYLLGNFDTATDIRLSEAVSYSMAEAGQILHARNGARYEVAAASATDHDETTPAGVKLYEGGPSYSTLARLSAAIARGRTWADGERLSAGAAQYTWSTGATEVPGAPNVIPSEPVTRGHFASDADAYAWSVDKNIPIRSSEDQYPIYLLGEWTTPARNPKFDDAAWRMLRTKQTVDNGDHGIGVTLGITIPDADHTADALGIAISGSAICNTPAGTYRADAVGVRGGGVIAQNITDGRCWGGLFEVSLPVQSAVGGVQADGRMNGLEIGVYNYGGVEEDDFDSLDAKIGLLFASAGGQAYARRNTAMIVAGNSFAGWYRGVVLRQVHTDYLYFTGPKSGARALNIVPSANWADDLIRLPNGKGIAGYNAAGTSATLMFRGADDGTVAELPVTTRIENTAAEALFILRRNQDAQTNAAARVRVDATNADGTSMTYGDISLTPSSNVADAEASQWALRTRDAGALLPQLTVGQGIVVGGATGGFQGIGTVSATGYFTNGLQVLGARKTGWALATGTATRTTFNTATATTQDIAERLKALIDDLHNFAGHGLIGA